MLDWNFTQHELIESYHVVHWRAKDLVKIGLLCKFLEFQALTCCELDSFESGVHSSVTFSIRCSDVFASFALSRSMFVYNKNDNNN